MSSMLEAELLVHLDRQIDSARRLLGYVLAQGTAIRARDVEAVLGRLSDVQTEMVARAKLETERTGLLLRAGTALGVPAEIAREHGINRALMRQELNFLSHLTRVLGQEPEPGYRPPGGAGATPPSHRALDLQA